MSSCNGMNRHWPLGGRQNKTVIDPLELLLHYKEVEAEL